jgi:hypothetical protein
MIFLRRAGVVLVLICVPAFVTAGADSGKIEFGFHYGSWSLNLLKPVFEDLADQIGEQIKNKQLDRIRGDRPDLDLREKFFQNEVDFDSSGSTFGFDLRWYPGGEQGSFSLGLSVVKTKMKFGITRVHTVLSLENAANLKEIGFTADGSGEVTANPLAALLSLRWDIAPRAVVHPYITLGFGAASVSALDETTLRYDFQGTLNVPDESPETIAESGTKTLLQLREEDRQRKIDEGSPEKPFDYPLRFFPFVQFHLGLKAKISRFVHLLVDFGALDGFALRGGLAVRI